MIDEDENILYFSFESEIKERDMMMKNDINALSKID